MTFTLQFSTETEKKINKAEHIVNVVSFDKSGKQTKEAFSQLVDKLIGLGVSGKTFTFITTPYLYTLSYYDLENPDKGMTDDLLHKVTKCRHEQWIKDNQPSIERLRQAGAQVDIREIFDYVRKDSFNEFKDTIYKTIKSKHGDAYNKHLNDVADIFSRKKKKELFRKLKTETPKTIKITQGVKQFLELEVQFSAYLRYLSQLDADNADYLNADIELYPGEYNSLFKYVFAKYEDAKNIPWVAYQAEEQLDKQIDSSQSTSSSDSCSSSDDAWGEPSQRRVSSPKKATTITGNVISVGLFGKNNQTNRKNSPECLVLNVVEQKPVTEESSSPEATLIYLIKEIKNLLNSKAQKEAILMVVECIEDTMRQLFEQIFEHSSKKLENFDFLFDKIKEYFNASCLKSVKSSLIDGITNALYQMFIFANQDELDDEYQERDDITRQEKSC